MRQRVSYNSDPIPFICKQDDLMKKTMEELEVIRNSGDGRSRRESSVALANLEDGAAAVIQPATIHQQVEEIGGSASAGLGLSPADKMDACHSIFHERAISEVSNI